MKKQDHIVLNKLLVKAHLGGLDDVDHRKLTKLIKEADAEDELTRSAEPGKAILTSRSGESSAPPRSETVNKLPEMTQ